MKATVPNKAIVGHGRLSSSGSADKEGELETLKAVDGVSEKEKNNAQDWTIADNSLK